MTTPIRNRIFINGTRRSDAKVISVVLTTSLTNPSRAEITLPYDKFGKNPLNRLIPVRIELDVLRSGSRIHFAGVVNRRIADRTPRSSHVTYECIGNEYLINAVTALRNYNDARELYGQEEVLSAGGIVQLLLGHVNSETSRNFQVNLGSLSTAYAGFWGLRGVSTAEALESLAPVSARGERARWSKTYINNTDVRLEIFYSGRGRRRRLNWPIVPTRKWNAQPTGQPNVNAITEIKERTEFANRLLVDGEERIFQTALTCSPAWDASIQADVLEAWNLYTDPELSEGVPNDYYNPLAERVGRLYSIPKVTLWADSTGNAPGESNSTMGMRARLEPRLVQEDVVVSSVKFPHGAFLVYKYTGDAEYTVKTDGFSIDNGEFVTLAKPEYRESYDAETDSFSYTLPSEMHLVCAVRDTVRLQHDTGKVGHEPYTITRYASRPEFKWTEYDHTWVLNANGSLTYVTGPTEVRKDESQIEAWAEDYLRSTQSSLKQYRVVCSRFPTTWDCGDMISSAYRDLNGLNIAQIEYIVDQEEARIADTVFVITGANTLAT